MTGVSPTLQASAISSAPTLTGRSLLRVEVFARRVRPGSPVYRQARLAAAQDATQRAREYAEAFGGRVTGLVEAADTGLLGAAQKSPPRPERRALAALASGIEQPDLPEFDFEPARQSVYAQVEARFTMTAPQSRE